MNRIDFFTWARHHFDHLIPIWSEIPNSFKGNFYISTHIHSKEEFHIPIYSNPNKFIFSDNISKLINRVKSSKALLVVADLNKSLNEIKRPTVLVSHGAGQTYISKEYEYQSIALRKHIVLDIVPNKYMKKVIINSLHGNEVRVVGCPKLDFWHKNFKKPINHKPVIAISFHFDRKLVSETRTAFPHFKSGLVKLANYSREKGWRILGHGHPLIIDELTPYYEELGFEIVRNFNDVMSMADVYICDNSSTLYEFASTDRSVVVLNAPWYRREVEHGLRFWEHADVGVNCDSPEDLIPAIEEALKDSEEQKKLRRKSVQAVYEVTDGTASKKAAKAIIDFLKSKKEITYSQHSLSIREDYVGIDEIINRDIAKYSRVLIYGAGEHTECLLKLLNLEKVNIVGVIDKDEKKHGKNIFGFNIYSKESIRDLDADVILISSHAYEDEIYNELSAEFKDIQIYPLYKKNEEFTKEIFMELYS